MGLVTSTNITAPNTMKWASADADVYDRATQLAGAIENLDLHDHSSTKGLQVPTAGIADGQVTAAKLATGAVTTVKIADSQVTAAKLAADAVTTVKIADSQVTAAKLATDAVTTLKIADVAVTSSKVANYSINQDKIAAGGVWTTSIADGAVTAAKLAAGVLPPFTHRQGGDATNWSVSGTTNYTPSAGRMQGGQINITIPANNIAAFIVVTFPVAFTAWPLCFATLAGAQDRWCVRASGGATTLTITVSRADGGTDQRTTTVEWLAIGPI